MTMKVVIIVMDIYGSHTDESIDHDSSKPTADGINISGIISIRNRDVSFMSSTFTILKQRLINSSTMP